MNHYTNHHSNIIVHNKSKKNLLIGHKIGSKTMPCIKAFGHPVHCRSLYNLYHFHKVVKLLDTLCKNKYKNFWTPCSYHLHHLYHFHKVVELLDTLSIVEIFIIFCKNTFTLLSGHPVQYTISTQNCTISRR